MILAAAGGQQIIFIIGYIIFLAALMYFIAIRPQKKQQKKQQELLSSMEKGDSVLTTSGFYGVIIDITDDTAVIRFKVDLDHFCPQPRMTVNERVPEPGL